jgi:hypothetical protein
LVYFIVITLEWYQIFNLVFFYLGLAAPLLVSCISFLGVLLHSPSELLLLSDELLLLSDELLLLSDELLLLSR